LEPNSESNVGGYAAMTVRDIIQTKKEKKGFGIKGGLKSVELKKKTRDCINQRDGGRGESSH